MSKAYSWKAGMPRAICTLRTFWSGTVACDSVSRYKAIQSAVKKDWRINKRETFDFPQWQVAGICWKRRLLSLDTFGLVEAYWEEWFSYESCGKTPSCEALGLVGVPFVADFSSVNSSRRFGYRGVWSQVRPFANSFSGSSLLPSNCRVLSFRLIMAPLSRRKSLPRRR